MAIPHLDREIRAKCVKSGIDLIVLLSMKEHPICGYEIIRLIYDRFRILLSPGTVYPVLRSFEEDGLIEAEQDKRRRVYRLTNTGRIMVEQLASEYIGFYYELQAFCNLAQG